VQNEERNVLNNLKFSVFLNNNEYKSREKSSAEIPSEYPSAKYPVFLIP
jgi:hypothetical protein